MFTIEKVLNDLKNMNKKYFKGNGSCKLHLYYDKYSKTYDICYRYPKFSASSKPLNAFHLNDLDEVVNFLNSNDFKSYISKSSKKINEHWANWKKRK